MRALVCFKIVPDLDMLSEKDWEIRDDFRIDTSFVKKMINPYDESALETALKLADSSENLCLHALTIGDRQSDFYLKTLYSLKFARAVRVETFSDLRFQPEVIAAVISKYVQQTAPQDVIFLGRQSGEGDNARTPQLVAEMLKWPCITEIIRAGYVDETHICVTSMTDDGVLTQTVRTPCVLSVGNVAGAYMRVPTLKDRMKYGKQDIEVIDMAVFKLDSLMDLTAGSQRAKTEMNEAQDGMNESHTGMNEAQALSYELTAAEVINHRRAGVILKGDSIPQKVKDLYHNYLNDRLRNL